MDIKKAIKTLNSLKQYNFSQGVVVRNNKVVSIEGKGGTKKMLKKAETKNSKIMELWLNFQKKNKTLELIYLQLV